MKDKSYFALMAVRRSELSEKGKGLDVVRFKAKDAKPVKISPHVKVFIYYNPVTELHQCHEEVCGLMIGCGPTKALAIVDVKNFFATANESMFFVQAKAFGKSSLRPEIEWSAAMDHYKAGHHLTV